MNTIDVALSYLKGMDKLDLEAATSGWAEDVCYYGIDQSDGTVCRKWYKGKAQAKGYIGKWLSVMEYIQYTTGAIMGNDKTVMVEWFDTARHKDGTEYKNQGVLIYEFNDQKKVREIRMYCDFGSLEEFAFAK